MIGKCKKVTKYLWQPSCSPVDLEEGQGSLLFSQNFAGLTGVRAKKRRRYRIYESFNYRIRRPLAARAARSECSLRVAFDLGFAAKVDLGCQMSVQEMLFMMFSQ